MIEQEKIETSLRYVWGFFGWMDKKEFEKFVDENSEEVDELLEAIEKVKYILYEVEGEMEEKRRMNKQTKKQ